MRKLLTQDQHAEACCMIRDAVFEGRKFPGMRRYRRRGDYQRYVGPDWEIFLGVKFGASGWHDHNVLPVARFIVDHFDDEDDLRERLLRRALVAQPFADHLAYRMMKDSEESFFFDYRLRRQIKALFLQSCPKHYALNELGLILDRIAVEATLSLSQGV